VHALAQRSVATIEMRQSARLSLSYATLCVTKPHQT
jgi:hypothetical protein